MKPFTKIRGRLYRERRAIFPTAPRARNEILIPDQWKLTLDKAETFLLIDDGINYKILVHTFRNSLTRLCLYESIK